MITAVTADPGFAASSALAGNRTRAEMCERSLLPLSAPPAPKNSGASDNGGFPQQKPPAETPQPEGERYGAASMFAAAVIAGNMPPVPTTMEELIMRIGSIPLPPESEARLKDLIA